MACIHHKSVPSRYSDDGLVDHRYFFRQKDRTGNYTCGLVRSAVADPGLAIVSGSTITDSDSPIGK
jgi:hypothetical protein